MNIKLLAAPFALMLLAQPTLAADFTINMVNKDATGRVMQFEPAFLKVAPGDTVHFVAVDKGHDTESLEGGIPEGAQPWKAKTSENLDVTFTVEGLYAFKCAPHFPMGMVGLIQVGDTATNLDAVAALKYAGKSKARMAELLGEQAAAATP
ncbi:MAG: pseudoazurin [Devosia sp.]